MKPKIALLFLAAIIGMHTTNIYPCSTFKLQKGEVLLYGHNLNQADMDVPGMVFINKRGIFKHGRTFSELLFKDQRNPSNFAWISRYGSVTFNAFGKDFPDGGMNEVGLYIWEMNEAAEFPKNENKPRLMHMNWIQYVLDSYSTIDEIIKSASEFQLDDGGMTWHYFISDASGNSASLAFIDGKVKVNKGNDMPVPGLFNTPYDKELEIIKYYKGYGGFYDIELENPRVPRFVKTAKMVDDYEKSMDPIDYGFKILKNITVDNIPEWSVLIDAANKKVYYKTRITPTVKYFDMKELDFSNNTPVSILDMDADVKDNVADCFTVYSDELSQEFLDSKLKGLLPEEFYNIGGLNPDEFIERLAYHSKIAELPQSQYFAGTWKRETDTPEENYIEIKLVVNKDAVTGIIFNGMETYILDHLKLIEKDLYFTFKNQKGYLYEGRGLIENSKMDVRLECLESEPQNMVFNKL